MKLKTKRTSKRVAGIRYSVRFALVVARNNQKGYIEATICHATERIRFSIGITGIAHHQWDKKAQRVIGNTLVASDAGQRIREICHTVDAWFEQDSGGSLNDLKATILGIPIEMKEGGKDGNTAKKTKGISGLFEAFILDRKRPGQIPFGKRTEQAYYATSKALQQYETESNALLTVQRFTASTKQQLRLAQELEQTIAIWLVTDYGFNDNTASRAMRRLSTVLKWAENDGRAGMNRLHTTFTIEKIHAKGMVALTEVDIAVVEALELPEHDKLWHPQHMFLLSIRTGLRFSDWHKVNPARWQETHQIVETSKTGGSAIVPHTPPIRRILQLYAANGMPECVQPTNARNAQMNVLIKELCKRAGLDRNVDKISRVRGRDCIEVVPFYEMVTTHTGRRTLVTLLREQGKSDDLISKQTGHSDPDSLSIYDRTTPETVARLLGGIMEVTA